MQTHILTETFGRIRIINLPDRADRRRSVTAELAKIGERVDGQAIAFQPAIRPLDAGGFETIGTRGCFLSHLQTLHEALCDGVSHLLILEDDVGFSRAERLAMPAALAALAEQEWDMCYGGSPVDLVGSPLTKVEPDTPVLLAHFLGFSAKAISQVVPFLEKMITRPAGSSDGGPMHVDGAYNWFRRANPDLRAFAATPHVVHQTASRTDIHENGLDEIKLLRPLLGWLRVTKNMLRERQ